MVSNSRLRVLLTTALIFGFSAAYLHVGIATTAQVLSQHQLVGHSYGRQGSHDGDNADHYEPYVDRWRRRFSSKDGYLFFKHMRKAAGSTMRQIMFEALKHHGQATLQQFLRSTNAKEARRHFPFLTKMQREEVESYYKNTVTRGATLARRGGRRNRKVYYIEQEFSAMDWQCRDVDPRWNDSISVVVLRHPIERHLSEFFYSGLPSSRLQIDRTKLYSNKTYTHMLSMFVQENLQRWAINDETKRFEPFQWYLSRRYVDNFQLRSLAGCASGECLNPPLHNISQKNLDEIRKTHPSNNINNATRSDVPYDVDSVCTMHPFYDISHRGGGMRACSKSQDRGVCSIGCDGPCHHNAAAWGPLDRSSLSRAVSALEGFDVVLLAETLDDGGGEQLAMLSDVLSVPRRNEDSNSPSSRLSIRRRNVNMEKRTRRERTHFYRDLIGNLTYPLLAKSLEEENALEIELYEHAVRLNRRMTERWKREVRWSDNDHAHVVNEERQEDKEESNSPKAPQRRTSDNIRLHGNDLW